MLSNQIIESGILSSSFFLWSFSHQDLKNSSEPLFDICPFQILAQGLVFRNDIYVGTYKKLLLIFHIWMNLYIHESYLSHAWILMRCRPYQPWFWRWIFQHFPSIQPSLYVSFHTPLWWTDNSLARTSSWLFFRVSVCKNWNYIIYLKNGKK